MELNFDSELVDDEVQMTSIYNPEYEPEINEVESKKRGSPRIKESYTRVFKITNDDLDNVAIYPIGPDLLL